MLQEMLALLPDAVTRMSAPVAGGIAGAGALLGLFGARFSRGILTLSLVAAGTFIGLHIPKWFGWQIDPMGPAVGAAIILGLSGYALTKMWEGILLGSLLATIAGAMVCNVMGATWSWPGIDWSATAVDTTIKIYQSIPRSLNKALPGAVAAGLAVGWLMVILWPKLGRVLLYSLFGMIVFVLCGVLALTVWRPEWIAAIPADPRVQVGAFDGLVLVAALVQWMGVKGSGNKKSVAPARSEYSPKAAVSAKSRSKNQAPPMSGRLAPKRFGSSFH